MQRVPSVIKVHETRWRVRYRLAGEVKKKDAWLEKSVEKLTAKFSSLSVRGGRLTGSIVISGDLVHPEKIEKFAETEHLFRLKKANSRNLVARHSKKVFSSLNSGIRGLTEGRMDFNGAAFVILIAHAAREIACGRLTAPSWFTALWMASTIYSRGLSGAVSDDIGGPYAAGDSGTD